MKKWQDYNFDMSVIITGNDIIEYMKVVQKSIEQFQPELSARSRHLTHGIVKLSGGTKMSSRKGNILRAVDVLDAATEANKQLTGQENETTVLGAVKYAFLKNRTGGDIIYDPEESVSLEGNSGPYLQYAHARARSILRKADEAGNAERVHLIDAVTGDALQPDERSLVRKLSEASEVIEKSVAELMPHHICTYLYELAQTFNRFYEKNRVIGDEREALRLSLVDAYSEHLKQGLTLLGIASPEKM
jgi:arginyl-tRNA synthetase